MISGLNFATQYLHFFDPPSSFQSNDEFLEDFIDVLRKGLQSFSDMDMAPYFFETPPVTHNSLNETVFEFVLIAAREFLKASPQPE